VQVCGYTVVYVRQSILSYVYYDVRVRPCIIKTKMLNDAL
jgi:hypothetical protein